MHCVCGYETADWVEARMHWARCPAWRKMQEPLSREFEPTSFVARAGETSLICPICKDVQRSNGWLSWHIKKYHPQARVREKGYVLR